MHQLRDSSFISQIFSCDDYPSKSSCTVSVSTIRLSRTLFTISPGLLAPSLSLQIFLRNSLPPKQFYLRGLLRHSSLQILSYHFLLPVTLCHLSLKVFHFPIVYHFFFRISSCHFFLSKSSCTTSLSLSHTKSSYVISLPQIISSYFSLQVLL